MRFKIYQSDNKLILYNGVLWGGAAGLIGVVIYFLTFLFLQRQIQLPVAAALFFGSVGGGILFTFATRFTAVEVSDEEIALLGRGNRFQKFSLTADQVGTFVEIHSVLGIGYFVSRFLKLNGKRYSCYNFTGQEFSKMSGEIAYLRRKDSPAQVPSDDLEETVYEIPYERIIREEEKKNRQFYLECVGVAVLMLLVWFLAVRTKTDWSNFAKYGTLVLLLVVFLAIPIAMQRFSLKWCRKRLPHRVIINQKSIQVDERQFDLTQIKGIRMTPVSYRFSGRYSLRRSLKIEFLGTVCHYYLSAAEIPYPPMEQYEILQKKMIDLCDGKGITFILEL